MYDKDEILGFLQILSQRKLQGSCLDSWSWVKMTGERGHKAWLGLVVCMVEWSERWHKS